MAKRKKVLTPEQEALLNQFQNNNNDNNDNNKLDENNNVKHVGRRDVVVAAQGSGAEQD